MNISLIKDVLDLVDRFGAEIPDEGLHTAAYFKRWVCGEVADPWWEGKERGRSAESVISTLLVHMGRYAKNYARSAMVDSGFSTQEDFIYLITLKAFGGMSKMELIKKNVHEKSAGIQVINRLIAQGWVRQSLSLTDKRRKVLEMTSEGEAVLENQMGKIRQATRVVSGNLSHAEKLQLILLLQKLNDFHLPIYQQGFGSEDYLEKGMAKLAAVE